MEELGSNSMGMTFMEDDLAEEEVSMIKASVVEEEVIQSDDPDKAPWDKQPVGWDDVDNLINDPRDQQEPITPVEEESITTVKEEEPTPQEVPASLLDTNTKVEQKMEPDANGYIYIPKDIISKVIDTADALRGIISSNLIIKEGASYFRMNGAGASCMIDLDNKNVNFNFGSIDKISILKYFTNGDAIKYKYDNGIYQFEDDKFKLCIRESDEKVYLDALKRFNMFNTFVEKAKEREVDPVNPIQIKICEIRFEDDVDLKKMVEIVKNSKDAQIDVRSTPDNKDLVFSTGDINMGHITIMSKPYNKDACMGKPINSVLDKHLFSLGYQYLTITMYFTPKSDSNGGRQPDGILVVFDGILGNGFRFKAYSREFRDIRDTNLM